MIKDYIYLDYAATTPVSAEVMAEMLPYFSDNFGNSSSQHLKGRQALRAADAAREKIAAAINASPNEIYFTSGGTESDAWAVRGAAYANAGKGRHLITSSMEHPAVLNNFKQLEKEGFSVTYLGADENGFVSVEELLNSVRGDTVLISVMTANNEIGTVQPVAEIGKIAKERKILFHTDAVQAMGCVNVDVKAMNADMVSMSAHKLYGPKGIGALYVRNGVRLNKFMIGGGQERNMRAGTLNVPSIVGMGKAVETAVREREKNNERLSRMRDRLIELIERDIPDARLNGDRVRRLANNVNFSFRFVEGESILLMLDMAGVGVSSGSACSSGSLAPSHVLEAIGVDAGTSQGTIRFTFGKYNDESDADTVAEKLTAIVAKLRAMSPLGRNS